MKNQLRATEGVFIITILIALLVCPGLYAEEETLPTPEEIIAKNIEAIGGIKALKNIKNKKTVKIRKYAQMNMGIKDTIYQERPNNLYIEMNTGIREGSNGKIAWDVSPNGGARLFEGNELSNYLAATKFDDLDVHYKSMKTKGIEQINGKDCYKVVKISEKGSEKIVYFDKKSFLILKTTGYLQNNKAERFKVESYNEEYKKINGILFPYKVVTFFNGQKYEEATIEKIELNIEMPEGIFDIPEEVKAIMDKK